MVILSGSRLRSAILASHPLGALPVVSDRIFKLSTKIQPTLPAITLNGAGDGSNTARGFFVNRLLPGQAWVMSAPECTMRSYFPQKLTKFWLTLNLSGIIVKR